MGVLAMLELDGETSELMAAFDELDRLLPRTEGLLVRIAAPTGEGMVLFQLWESAEARRRNAEEPSHAEALVTSGMRAAVRASRSRVFEDAVLRPVAGAQTP